MGATLIQRSGQRYQIGALTTYADPNELESAFRRAAPGERLTYAIGPVLGRNAPASALARRMQEQGGAHLAQERSGNGWRYFIEKRPMPVRRSGAVSRVDPQSLDGRVYALLADAADAGRPCPSNDRIAQLLDLGSRYQARDRVKALVRAGLVRVVQQQRFGGRVIEIVASGLRAATQ